MSAKLFLNVLQEEGLLEEKVLVKLRQQIASSSREFSAKDVAAILVNKGHLTQFLAKKMLKEVPGEASSGAAPSQETPIASPDATLLAPKPEIPAESESTPAETPSKEEEVPLPPPQPIAKEQPVKSPKPDPPGMTPPAPKPIEKPPGRQVPTAAEETPAPENANDDLGLAPSEEMGLAASEPAPEEDTGLTPIEEEDTGLTPIEDTGLTPIEEDSGLTPMEDTGLTPMEEPADLGGGLFDAHDPFATEGEQPEPERKSSGKHKKVKTRKSQWESPLLFGGGLVLVILIIVGGFLGFTMLRGNADKTFQHAQSLYEQQSYSQAVEAYDLFLASFPNDKNAGLARVRRGLALLRNDVEHNSNKEEALRTAQKVLPEIEGEEQLSDAHPELAGLLPQIVEGFVIEAQKTPDVQESADLVALAREAMQLVNNGAYMPTSQRKSQEIRIDGILEDLRTEEREISRDRRLAEVLVEIASKVKAGETSDAYEIRKKLIHEYNDLASNPQLDAAVRAISERERDIVETTPKSIDPVADPVEQAALSEVMLVSQAGEGIAGLASEVVLELVNGTVYAFNAADGTVLWRRHVGYDTDFQPIRTAPTPDADAVYVDSRNHELVRAKVKTGEHVWRLPVGEPFISPVVTPDYVALSTPTGKIVSVDIETGESSLFAQLPQKLRTSPGYNDRHPQLYQAGDHSNLYVLAPHDLKSREVFYVGHKEGTIVTPPVVQKGYIFLAENAGSDYSLLHIIETDANGLDLKVAQQPIRLKGKVITPPQIYNRNVLVVTDLGAMYVFGIDAGRPGDPVKADVESVPRAKTAVLGYPVAGERTVWVGDRRLSRFDVQLSQGVISTPTSGFQEDIFVSPLKMIGDVVFHVRRKRNSPAYAVAASRDPQADPLWETILSPLAGPPLLDESLGKYVAMSAEGRPFAVPSDIAAGFSTQAYSVRSGDLPSDSPLNFGARVSKNVVAYASNSRSDILLVADSTRGESKVRKRVFAASKAPLATAPVAFAGGVLTPSTSGRVYLFDPTSGENLAEPFQPPVKAGASVAWRRPALINDKTFALADDRQQLYLVSFNSGARTFLKNEKQAPAGGDVVSPLAVAGTSVFAVLRGNETDRLVAYKATDLTAGQEVALKGRWTWGPYAVGDRVLVASDAGELICVSAANEVVWNTSSSFTAPFGEPLAVAGGDIVLSSAQGDVWRVAAASGEELSHIRLREPLIAGPQIDKAGLLLTGVDGVFYIAPMLAAQPTAEATSAAP